MGEVRHHLHHIDHIGGLIATPFRAIDIVHIRPPSLKALLLEEVNKAFSDVIKFPVNAFMVGAVGKPVPFTQIVPNNLSIQRYNERDNRPGGG
jgi:hypothetical protein